MLSARKIFSWLAFLAASIAHPVHAQNRVGVPTETVDPTPQPGRLYRIGILTYASLELADTVKQALADLGYVEGANVTYLERTGNRDLAAMDGLARDVVAWRPDAIISLMTNAHLALQKATRENPVPVVFWSADPQQTGVVETFRRPGQNFTGFTYETQVQMLEIRFLKRAVPDLICVGHLYNHTYAPAPSTLRELQKAGAMLGVPVKLYEVLDEAEISETIAQIKADGCGGFVVGPHEILNRNGGLIGRTAIAHGLAAVSIQTSVTDGGGLAAFSPPFDRGWRAMAPVIGRLMNGADPATIAVERGFKSPLTINLDAAKALGLKLPADLIDEADTLIGDDHASILAAVSSSRAALSCCIGVCRREASTECRDDNIGDAQ